MDRDIAPTRDREIDRERERERERDKQIDVVRERYG